jgi:hypothetical protein
MKPTVAVFYEDSRAAGAARFPLHDLTLACVADLVGVSNWRSLDPYVDAIPKNGNAKVLQACKTDAPRRMKQPHIVAVLDGDKLHHLFPKVSKAACKRDVQPVFRAEVPDARVELAVIDDNIESLISALRASGLASTAFDDALAKDVDARDRVLAAAVNVESARTGLVASVRSFRRLVERIARYLPADARP